jgi:lipoprotein NlpD
MLHRSYKFIFLCTLIAFVSGCVRFVAYDPDRNKSTNRLTKVVTHHRVKVGETLYSIAFEYGHDHRDVALWNGIREPYIIYPNQKLRVTPVSANIKKVTKSFNGKKHNTVKRNEVNKTKKVVEKTRYSPNVKWHWPTQGKVVSTFSIQDPGRRGIDIHGKKGQRIVAAAAGHVVYRGNGLRGYGNLVIIKHNDAYFSAYAHTENVVVKEDENVKLGQRIADMSNTNDNKTELHFEIRRNGKPVNPLKYLPKQR